MRVLVIVKATPNSEAGDLPTAELLECMGRFNDELVKAGVLLDAAGLKPTSKAARVTIPASSTARRTVIDGPFTETKELIAGYWLWEVKSLEEAIDWVKRCPNPMPGPSEIEIRPLYEMSDFGA